MEPIRRDDVHLLTRRELRLPKFIKWLTERGAEILANTNEWEILRFRANGKVSIIYQSKKNGLTFTGEAADAWIAYKGAISWDAGAKVNRGRRTSVKLRTLLQRDGACCFFCDQVMLPDEMTIEHLVPVAHKGPSHLSNLVLCHQRCNLHAGHLSVREKIKIRENNLNRKRGNNGSNDNGNADYPGEVSIHGGREAEARRIPGGETYPHGGTDRAEETLGQSFQGADRHAQE